jgi:hypothetical protein
MKREIKFRTWDKKTKKMWNLGGLPEIEDSRCKYWDDFEIMQYTGLKDKNGKEIYEGDILDFENSYITEISWKDNGFRLNDNSIHSDLSHGVIIGNIYENPDLIKQ